MQDSIRPARGKILVKHVETAETLPNGKIIVPEGVRENLAAQQAEVVAVGDLDYCKDFGECPRAAHVLRENVELSTTETVKADIFHPFGGKAGDWVLLAPRSLVESGTDGLYFAKQDDVLAVLTT